MTYPLLRENILYLWVMKHRPWLLHNEEFYEIEWMFEFANDMGVFCEEHCKDYAENYRFPYLEWTDCPHCRVLEMHYELRNVKQWKCKNCEKRFSITTGTYLENNKIPLTHLFRLCYLVGNLSMLNSRAIARDTGLTQKTTYWMLIKIKKTLNLKGVGTEYNLPIDLDIDKILDKLFSLKTSTPIIYGDNFKHVDIDL